MRRSSTRRAPAPPRLNAGTRSGTRPASSTRRSEIASTTSRRSRRAPLAMRRLASACRARARQAEANLRIASGALRERRDVVEAISDRLVELAGRVPERVPAFNLGGAGARLVEDRRIYDYRAYPPQIWKQPGEKAPNPVSYTHLTLPTKRIV